jgi:hypothetical protein
VNSKKDPFTALAEVILRRQTWGPFLVIVGGMSLFQLQLGGVTQDAEPTMIGYVKVAIGACICLAGILMMFLQLRADEDFAGVATPATSSSEPELTVLQLSKNYELLRRQTTQGFALSGVFMALGFLVILSGSAGSFFGFTKAGSDLTTVAGVLMEFISATSLLIYRLNFTRLNVTTDRLDSAWRILTAHKLAESLPEEDRASATQKLIDALLAPLEGGAQSRAVTASE